MPFRAVQTNPRASLGAIPARYLPIGVSQTGDLPSDETPSTISPFFGPESTVKALREAVLGPRGERSVVVYKVTENVVRSLRPKDYLGEILAVRYFLASRVRYKNDPLATELVSDPQRMMEEILKTGRAIGDCDDIAGLGATMLRQLGRETEWITVGFQPGGTHSHIFSRVREPKTRNWIVVDPVAGVSEQQMLSRVKTWKSWRID